MARHATCDGIRRRDLLRVGMLGGLGLNLAGYLRSAAAGEVAAAARARQAIFIELGGGPSHMDTFDLKPEAPAEYRGEFKPIDTNVPGVQISEHLPLLARCADKYAILRGVSHNAAAHELGRKYMTTGNRPIVSLQYPMYGCVVAKELPATAQVPTSVAIPRNVTGAGYLGVRYNPLETNSTPQVGRPFSIRGITLGGNVTVADVERRTSLLTDLDTAFAGFEKQNDVLTGLDEFSQQAYSLVTSKEARQAFDVSQEAPEIVARFGESALGQSCLLAARLIGAGVRFVTTSFGGWDTHQDNFNRLTTRQLPPLDQALSALLTTLAERNQLESTLVVVTGEFGRTPKVNARGGRDHWPRAMFVVLAGGGVRGGQVLGASSDKGEGPAGEGYTPEQVGATIYHALGIDHTLEYQTATGRPVMLVRDGSVIRDLFG